MKKSTLVTLVVFAALLVGALVVLTRKPERGISRLSLQVEQAQVDRIVVTGKSPVELTKEGDAWRVAGGRVADEAAVQRVLDSIEKVQSSDLATDQSSRFVELEVDDEKGHKVELFAGKRSLGWFVVGKSQGGSTYVRVPEGVYKVSGISASAYARPEGSWVEKKLFTDKVEEVTRVEVKQKGEKPYALVKKDKAWALEDAAVLPKGLRFDPDAARTLVTSLTSLRVKDFVEPDPGAEKTGLGEGADSLTFTVTQVAPQPEAKEGEEPKPAVEPAVPATVVTRTVRLGAAEEDKDVFAAVDGKPDVFTVSESVAKGLRKPAADLRDWKLMALEREKVRKLTITDGKNTTTFEKKGDAWTLAKSTEKTPAGFEFDPAAVDRRLTALVQARALKQADNNYPELGGSKITATLEGGRSATLTFGKEAKDDNREVVYAQGNADAGTYWVAKWTKQNLMGGLATFKKAAEQPGGGMGNIDPQALSKLPPEIRESLMKQMQQQRQQEEMMKRLQKAN